MLIERQLTTGVVLIVVSFMAVQAVAQRNLSIETSQEAVADYESLILIPMEGASRSTPTITIDRFRADVVMESNREFNSNWLRSLDEKIEEHEELEGYELLEGNRLVLHLASMASDITVVSNGRRRSRTLTVGRLRHVPSLREHFFGEACAETLPMVETPVIDSYIEAHCSANGEVASIPRSLLAGASASELELISLLLLETNPPLRPGVWGGPDVTEALRQVEAESEFPTVRFAAKFGRACILALRNEATAALDALDSAISLATQDEDAADDAQLQLLRTLGTALYTSRLAAAIASDDWIVTIYLYERYGHWAGGELDAGVELAVASAFRSLALPEKANTIYLDLFTNQVGDARSILEELLNSYIEADDLFRAREAAAFLIEQYPGHPVAAERLETIDGLLNEEVPTELLDIPAEELTQGDLALRIGNSWRNGDREAAQGYAERLRNYPQENGRRHEEFRELAEAWADLISLDLAALGDATGQGEYE